MIEYLRLNLYKELIKAENIFDDKSKILFISFNNFLLIF